MAGKKTIRFVYVQDFLKNDQGEICGVSGLTWPDKEKVSVTLDGDCEKAKNPHRKTFAQFAKGFKIGMNRFVLEKGAMLRLRTEYNGEEKDGVQPLKTDWINAVTYNNEQTKSQTMFGLVQAKTRTPSEVYAKRKEILESPDYQEWAKAHQGKRDQFQEVERRLSEVMGDSEKRYNASYYVFEPQNIMRTNDPAELREKLVSYFSDPVFHEAKSENSGLSYMPVRPTLIVRGLNDSGEYTGKRVEFTARDVENVPQDGKGNRDYSKRTFKSPEACADEVIASLPKNCASWSVLPAKVYNHSQFKLFMNKANEFGINSLRDLHDQCHEKLPPVKAADGKMEYPVKEYAVPCGLKFNDDSDKPCVVDLMRDYRQERVDPVLVSGVKPIVPGHKIEYEMLPLSPEMKKMMGVKEEAKEETVEKPKEAPAPEETESCAEEEDFGPAF